MQHDKTHEEYLAEVREARPELAAFIQYCGRENFDNREHEIIGRRIRMLAQNARLHGYNAIAKTAEDLQAALTEPYDLHSLSQKAKTLLHDVNHALTLTSENMMKQHRVEFAKGAPPKPLVLIADDDRMMREIMEHMFRESFELMIAQDGKQAYDMIMLRPPHLAILDDMMPNMSGLKLLENIKAMPALAHIPIIMLTGSNRPQDVARGSNAGALDYIIKPFDPLRLMQTVASHMGIGLISTGPQVRRDPW